MLEGNVSQRALRRLPLYLHYLRTLPEGVPYVSATQIAAAIGLGDVQVRKDLAAVSGRGRPKIGYEAKRLMHTLESLLTSDETVRFCIVGMGHLGTALAQYHGFAEYGLCLAAVFDSAPGRVGQRIEGLAIAPVAAIKATCEERGIRIGVIAVPPPQAQGVCNALADAGIDTIWNFAPAHLTVPEGVYVEHENMAAQLGMLSHRLRHRMGEADTGQNRGG